jgi:hypothetical protein
VKRSIYWIFSDDVTVVAPQPLIMAVEEFSIGDSK